MDAQSIWSIDNPFEWWLGPQSIEKHEISNIEPPGELRISLSVRKGKNVQLQEGIKEVATCEDGKVIAVSQPVFEKEEIYIVAMVTAVASAGSEYVVDELSVRVTRGLLINAVVHLRPGKYSRLPSGQFAATYKIPNELNVPAGVLEFSIIRQRVHKFSQAACQAKTADWLGPQNKRAAIPSELVEKILPGVVIETKVVAGPDLMLPTSENRIVTISGGRITEVDSIVPEDSRQYLVVTVSGAGKGTIGRAIYELGLTVVAGQLSGAVVHCRSDAFPESISDPLVAVFAVPADYVLKESVVSTEVIRIREK